jgi:predicted Fe-S protein YdhL (DUF1289 family)
MKAEPVNQPRPGFPASPCNQICTLDDDKICLGCKRSMDEIVAWSAMTADAQWAVIRQLEKRKSQ